MRPPLPVERLDPVPTPEAFAAAWLAPRPTEGTLPPVILPGASPVRWTFDDVEALEPDASVSLGIQKRGTVFGTDAAGDAGFRIEYMPFRDALARVRSSDPNVRYYIRRQHLEEKLHDMRARLANPAHARRRPGGNCFIWVSQGDVVSPLHMDTANNFFCQTSGRKRFLLYSPNDFDRMYPHPVAEVSHCSLVDAEHPDHERHPLFAEAQCYEAVLEPGDMLHLPAYWWHHVRSLEPSVSLSFMTEPEPWQAMAFHLARARAPVASYTIVPAVPPVKRWDQREGAGVRDDD